MPINLQINHKTISKLPQLKYRAFQSEELTRQLEERPHGFQADKDRRVKEADRKESAPVDEIWRWTVASLRLGRGRQGNLSNPTLATLRSSPISDHLNVCICHFPSVLVHELWRHETIPQLWFDWNLHDALWHCSLAYILHIHVWGQYGLLQTMVEQCIRLCLFRSLCLI